MLAYAYKLLNQKAYKDLASEEFQNTADMLSAILVKGAKTEIKRGLNRNYIPFSEETSSLRGRIDISASIKSQTLLKKKMICSFDEFYMNIILNQIIKSTLILLIKSDIPSTRKKEIKKLLVFFQEVDEIDLYNVEWKFIYNRNNQNYQMLISICQLIVDGLIVSTSRGEKRLMDFFDDQKMHTLYEKFILEYYRKEFPFLSINSKQIPWQIDDGKRDFLPIMQSDITISDDKNVLIIDAKYYSRIGQSNYNTDKIRSNNLYQIFTYVKNKDYELKDSDKFISGMLLYAKTDEGFYPDYVYKMSGNKIAVKTLDLSLSFKSISQQLDDIIYDYFEIKKLN